jgi:N-methylhydantoinase A
VARELGLKRAAVPLFAAGLSAWGMLHTDLRYELAQSAIGAAGIPEDAKLRSLFDTLEADGRARMAGWYQGEISARRSADMRYGEQVFEIAVPLDHIAWDGAWDGAWYGPDTSGPAIHAPGSARDDRGLAGQFRAAFHARHRALFTYDLPEEEVVLVNARIAVIGALPMGEATAPPAAAIPAAPLGERRIGIEGATLVAPVFDFDSLTPDQEIAGPALIESATTTVLLRPGDAARMDGRGWLDIAVG